MKLFLIDGHALVFKMYYAFLGRPMVNSKGTDTSILFGFTKYLLELIQREKPTHLAVSFDPPGGTFRNELYPAYKANRGETPQLVIDALEPLTAICKALRIPVLMIPGFEADDVIGSMALRSAAEGFEVYMVTPDKDYGQLVRDHVFQYRPGKGGGDDEILGPAEVCAKWNIASTDQVIDILAICGDASDNVPGVDGVGPVGAAKLLAKYGSTDGIYAHLDELTPRQKALFEAAADHIGLSRELVTIKTDIPLDVTAEDMTLKAAFYPAVAELFSLYEFRSLRRLLPEAEGVSWGSEAGSGDIGAAGNAGAGAGGANEGLATAGVDVVNVHGAAKSSVERKAAGSPDAFAQAARKAGSFALEFEDGALHLATPDGDGILTADGAPEAFRSLLEDAALEKYGHSLKRQMNALSRAGIALEGRLLDIELMHYLLNPERSHSLENLAESYLGVALGPDSSPAPTLLFGDDEGEPAATDFGLRSAALLRLGQAVLGEMAAAGLEDLYFRIEEPLIGVLSRMEMNGVKIDVSSLQDFAASLRERMLEKEAEVRQIAGEPSLNVASPKQIGEVLFEKMKLSDKVKKSPRGAWPTDEETLSELAGKSPIIDAILDYRGTRKLLSTYIEPFPTFISQRDGRVHTTFNQALTSTGRLSSSNPNLQNIPIRTEEGQQIRKAFVPGESGWVMMSADYSQIELRVMAHLSCDRHLVSAFRQGVDVHAATASKIFGVPVEEVTPEQRRRAKTANFGIMYGISSFGLAQRLRCSRSEAKELIDGYFASFPAIKSFIADTLTSARETGYVETIFGRRRYIPDLNSHNGNVRALAERNAVNAPIQGSAADIIKLAMIAVDKGLREMGLRSRLVLQIHDELLLEVPPEEIETVRELLVSRMENVMELSVPLTVDCNYGKTWLEAH